MAYFSGGIPPHAAARSLTISKALPYSANALFRTSGNSLLSISMRARNCSVTKAP
jgi:hypothetical protein